MTNILVGIMGEVCEPGGVVALDPTSGKLVPFRHSRLSAQLIGAATRRLEVGEQVCVEDFYDPASNPGIIRQSEAIVRLPREIMWLR